MISFRPEPGEVGERVDAVLASRAKTSRAAARDALVAGDVTVGGRIVRPSHRLRPTDEVTGNVATVERELPGPESIPLAVRYSDSRVLVVSKPAGLVTHPGHGHRSGTLINALLGLGGELSGIGSERPGIIHRLDKGTSGLLLVAKDDDAHAKLSSALKRRAIDRRYLALVRGTPAPPTGTVDAPIGRHAARRTVMAVVSSGRPAVTNYRLLAAGDGASLVEVRLETGRTHQVRVHLAHIGHPVLGDRTYGGVSDLSRSLRLDRPFLHAHHLAFPHPDDGRIVEVADPLPEDLSAALAAAGIEEPLA